MQSLAETSERDSGRLRSRKVTRDYKIFRHGDKEPVSEVTAEIRFVSDGESTYEVTHATGSSRGEKVVRKILARETKLTTKEHYSEITSQNYQFSFVRQENLNGHAAYILRLTPRKKDRRLLRGLIWVDANTLRIWKIEGTPAVKPSWWVKTLKIRLS